MSFGTTDKLGICKPMYVDFKRAGQSTLVELLVSEAASTKHMSRHVVRRFYHYEGVTVNRLRRNLQLLGRSLEAHVSFSTDGTANEALRCLSAISEAAKEQDIFHAFNWAGATIDLRRLLTTIHCPPYDERLLPDLYEVTRNSSSTKDFGREFAYLMLWHPTSPDPFIALEMIKNEVRERCVWKIGHRAVAKLEATQLKTMLVFELQGATSEAQWARDILKKDFGKVRNDRQRIVGSFTKDPKLQRSPGLRMAASAIIRDDPGHGVVDTLPDTSHNSKPESLMPACS